MSELRKDPASRRWVITTDDRAFVPLKQGQGTEESLMSDDSCRVCGVMARENIIYSAGSGLKVIPSSPLYLKTEEQLKKTGAGIYDVISGTGADEVIIESAEHNLDLDTMADNDVNEIIKAYRVRFIDLKKDTRIEHILIFRNRGASAGGSIAHPNSRVMALPVVPEKSIEELSTAKEYYDFKGRFVYCDIINNEKKGKERLISETNNFISIAPFASQACFEAMILPKWHDNRFDMIDDIRTAELAMILKDLIRRIKKALDDPPYNMMLHTSPVKDGKNDYYHWHIEIMPRIKSIAGFEWGSGFYINPTLPEHAADYLRRI